MKIVVTDRSIFLILSWVYSYFIRNHKALEPADGVSAKIFASTACSWRRAIAEGTGRLPEKNEEIRKILHHSLLIMLLQWTKSISFLNYMFKRLKILITIDQMSV